MIRIQYLDYKLHKIYKIEIRLIFDFTVYFFDDRQTPNVIRVVESWTIGQFRRTGDQGEKTKSNMTWMKGAKKRI